MQTSKILNKNITKQLQSNFTRQKYYHFVNPTKNLLKLSEQELMVESEKIQPESSKLFPASILKWKAQATQPTTMNLQLNEISIVSEHPKHVLPGIPSNAKFWKM
eukprot:gene10724-3344_t